MTGRTFSYQITADRPAQAGLIVLQSEETIEQDFRRLLPPDFECLTSRVPSDDDVTTETLAAMEAHLGAAADLFPTGVRFACTAYACTSGAAQIGPDTVGASLKSHLDTPQSTDPVSALIAACQHLGITRLGLLSPYVATVSNRLRSVLKAAGIDTPVFGSFNESREATVVRIDGPSIIAAATALAEEGGVDALFLSCTNLRTMNVIDALETRLDLPVLSSNLVLAWHMCQLAGIPAARSAPGRLFRQP